MSQRNELLDPDIAEENESRLLDTSGAEELSVKTLADMFDFRLGEQVHFVHIKISKANFCKIFIDQF